MQHCCRLLLMRRLSGEEIELSQASRDEVCSLCTRWSSSRVQQEQDNAHNTSGLGERWSGGRGNGGEGSARNGGPTGYFSWTRPRHR